MNEETGILDVRHVEWVSTKVGSSVGMLPKTTVQNENQVYHLKMSSYSEGFGVYGCEAVMEAIAHRAATLLGIETVEYTVRKALIRKDGTEFTTPLCISKDFKQDNSRTDTFEKIYRVRKMERETPLDFAYRMGWREFIEKMFVLDYIIVNLDRHGANVEVDLSSMQPVKLFDHGNSFLSHRTDEQIGNATYDDRGRVNNYIGAMNLLENLKTIAEPVRINEIKPEHRAVLFSGMGDFITRARRDTIWTLLNGRLEHARKLQAIRFR